MFLKEIKTFFFHSNFKVASPVRAKNKKSKKGNGDNGKDDSAKKEPMRPKRKGIMSFIMGSEDKKGALENIADFIHNLMKPSANRQDKLLSDIFTRLEALNEKKMNDTMRNNNNNNNNDATLPNNNNMDMDAQISLLNSTTGKRNFSIID